MKGSNDIAAQIGSLVNDSSAYHNMELQFKAASAAYSRGVNTGDDASQEKDAYKTLTEDKLTEYKEERAALRWRLILLAPIAQTTVNAAILTVGT